MAEPVGVEVEGLAEFRKHLRQLAKASGDDSLTKQLKTANWETATQVVGWAQTKASGEGRQIAKAAREGLKASKAASASQVILGGRKLPWAIGGEFGSIIWPQLPGWRGNKGGAGYFLYPTIRERHAEIRAAYERQLDELTKEAFPD